MCSYYLLLNLTHTKGTTTSATQKATKVFELIQQRRAFGCMEDIDFLLSAIVFNKSF